MVDEFKKDLRKLENIIGCTEKLNVKSKIFYDELIKSLLAKYKKDLDDTLKLHRLELFYDLVEEARRKEIKSVDLEEKYILSKMKTETDSEEEEDEEDDDEKEDEQPIEENIEKPIMAEEVSVKPEDVDNWKNLMTLSKIYYVLEHPDSEGLPWKRRLKKKKIIRNFGDKDLIEWRVAQHFRLKSLEDWAAQRMEEQKMADKSPYDFDDLFEDDKSRELENIFEILETKKEKKRKISKLAKILRRKRPFIFTGETVKDWTESYSEDSEESGADEMDEDALQIFEEETDFKVGETPEPRTKVVGEESSISDESSISEIFSSFEEFKPYKDPKFDAIEDDTPIEVIYDICFDAVNETKPKEKSVEEIKSEKLKMTPSEKFALGEDSQVDHLREVEVAQALNNVIEQVDKEVQSEREFDKVIETEQVPDKIVEQVLDETIENVVENVKKRVLFKESETEQDETGIALGKIIDKKTMDHLAAERLKEFDMSSEMTELEKLMDELHLEETDDDEKQIGELTKELILKGTKSFIFEDTVEDKIEKKLKEAMEQSDYAEKILDTQIPAKKLDEDSIQRLKAMEGYDDTKPILDIQKSVQEVAEELFGKVAADGKYDEKKQHIDVQDSVRDVGEALIRKVKAGEIFGNIKQVIDIQDSVLEIAEEIVRKVKMDEKSDDAEQIVDIKDKVREVTEELVRKVSADERSDKHKEILDVQESILEVVEDLFLKLKENETKEKNKISEPTLDVEKLAGSLDDEPFLKETESSIIRETIFEEIEEKSDSSLPISDIEESDIPVEKLFPNIEDSFIEDEEKSVKDKIGPKEVRSDFKQAMQPVYELTEELFIKKEKTPKSSKKKAHKTPSILEAVKPVYELTEELRLKKRKPPLKKKQPTQK